MNTRLFAAACSFAGLALTHAPAAAQTPAAQAPAAQAPAADTPAVAVVRQFLTARAAGNSAAAYPLLDFGSGMHLSEQKYAAGTLPPAGTPKQMSDPIYGFGMLLADTHNTQHYTFTLIGPDPKDPHTVLVRAVPPASSGVSPVTVRVVTEGTLIASAPRVDVLASLKRNAPEVFAHADQNIKRVQSQNHLKELWLDMVQYEQDHDDAMPDAARWVDELLPYAGTKEVFHDPAAPASQTYSYAYNRNLSHQPLSLDGFNGLPPATLVVLFESAKGVKNAADTGQSVPHPGRHREQNSSRTGTDYLFADGHVKWFPDGTKPSFKLTGK